MGIHKGKILNWDYKPTEILTISPRGNEVIDKIDIDMIANAGHYDSKIRERVNPYCSNKKLVEFSLENTDGYFIRSWNGCNYSVFKSGGDESYYVYTFFYFNGNEMKYYIPLRGNPINPITLNDIPGYWEESSRQWFLHNGICDTNEDFNLLESEDCFWEYLEPNLNECIKEFESILILEQDNISKWKNLGGE